MTWLLVALSLLPVLGPLAPRVWVIGDSNGWLLMQELPKLAREDGVELGGNPVGGTSVPWWVGDRGRTPLWQARKAKADVYVVVLGTNDALVGADFVENVASQYKVLVEKLGRNGAAVLFVGPPELPKRGRRGADAFRSAVAATGAPLLDSRGCRFEVWDDGVHPSIPGRKVWARWVWDWVMGRPQAPCRAPATAGPSTSGGRARCGRATYGRRPPWLSRSVDPFDCCMTR